MQTGQKTVYIRGGKKEIFRHTHTHTHTHFVLGKYKQYLSLTWKNIEKNRHFDGRKQKQCSRILTSNSIFSSLPLLLLSHMNCCNNLLITFSVSTLSSSPKYILYRAARVIFLKLQVILYHSSRQKPTISSQNENLWHGLKDSTWSSPLLSLWFHLLPVFPHSFHSRHAGLFALPRICQARSGLRYLYILFPPCGSAILSPFSWMACFLTLFETQLKCHLMRETFHNHYT